MSLSPEDFDQVFALLAVVTPAKPDAALAAGWELILGDEDVTLDEVQKAMVRIAKRQTFVAPNEVLSEVRTARKERLSLAGASRPGREALDVAHPVYGPGHPKEGQPVDPDDRAEWLDAVKHNRHVIARGLPVRDLSSILPGWRPQRAIGGGQ